METDKKLGLVALAGGLALAVTGIVILSRKRQLSGGLGRAALPSARGVTNAGGMTLKHYRGAMPIKKRVGILQDLVWQSVQDPRMRKLALKITSGCPARDGECEARAIYNWTRKNIRYTGDVGVVKMGKDGPVEGVDLFQSAYRTVEFGGGDCDDHSVLNATLLTLNGITSKFRITAPPGAGSGEWAHIYATAGLSKNSPSEWRAIDTTLPGNNYGVEARYGQKVDFPA